MSDSSLFTTGSLFSSDYLEEAIRETDAYDAVDVDALRAKLDEIAARFPQSSATNESQTEDDFIWPILEVLGWADSLRQQNLSVSGRDNVPDGLLFADAAAKATANKHDAQSRRYEHGIAVVESKRWDTPLDRASRRQEATAPSTQMLRYLRRIDDITSGRLRWGILSNGRRWRLYWAGARSISEEFLEIDLGRTLELNDDADLFATKAARDHWLRVFAVMFGRSAFLQTGTDAKSFHERARADTIFYEERVAANLSELVFEQVFPSLARALAEAAPDASLQEVRDATLILLYRLLFVLYAEDRDLLPVNDSRYNDYALRPLRIEIGKRISQNDVFAKSAAPIWSRVNDLSRIIDKGDSSVGIPPYNGGLFAGAGSTETPGAALLQSVRIADHVMAPALDALSYERSTGLRRYINYRNLSVQQLGSIYERLLEFELAYETGPEGDTGFLSVRPNLFARKNTGSYFTPDDLVGLILDETLSPLIEDCRAAFQAAVKSAMSAETQDRTCSNLKQADAAKAILSLRVCDPAMGSGHFLVSLVDTLTDHVLDAIAEAAELGVELDYVSPLVEQIEDIRAVILSNAKAENWAVDEAQLDDRHIVRRMVLKRCVYGVDKNPMAVELAKVALWLHTFTVGAPLSFIDHHLAVGDSLFGLWVRDAIDKAGKGGELFYNEDLRNAERQAAFMQKIEALTDAEIGEAYESAAMWRDIEYQIGPFDSFVSFIHALDWLDLKGPDKALVTIWLDGLFGDPLPIARGKKAPEEGKAKPEELERFTEIWQAARDLITEERFLNWQIIFPGVWKNWTSKGIEGGFDAVVGNPPWDRIKLQQVEWFAARRPEIAKAQRASDRKRMIAALKDANDPLFVDYEKADKRAADTLRVARKSGHYPLLSRGDINLYSLFVERAHALVKPRGIVGLLTPSGIASDLSASAFFRKLATGGHLKALYDFENKKVFFPDVHASFKFCIIVASPERTFEAAKCAFYLHNTTEIDNPENAFPIAASDFARVNPNTGTAPIFRSRRDMALTTAIYERCPVLVDKSGDEPVAAWPVKYTTMFHMTNDSGLFRTRAELEEQEGAWPIGGNRWQSAAGEWVPLYEGKMVQAFDHRAASVVVNPENVSRPAQPYEVTAEQKADPEFLPDPQFFVSWSNINLKGDWHLGMKHVTAPTNMRSMIAGIVPACGAGNSLPIINFSGNAEQATLGLACMNSIPFDFALRQKVQGQNLNWYIVEQLPVIPPAAYTRMFGPKSAADIVKAAVLELTYTAHDMALFARDMGYVDDAGEVLPPFIWDEERRLHVRAKLDALYFILYGVFDPADSAQSRDDIRYIYSTFPIVERQEIAAHGTYRSRDLCLAWVNALLAGQPDAKIDA